jgi:PAS domain S-box-containing protein
MNDSEKAREQLIEELKLFRTLIDTLPDRIFVKDTKGRFVIANKAVAEHAELPFKGDVIGKTDFDLYPPEKAEAFYRREQEIIRTGQPMVNEEVWAKHPVTGQPIWSLSVKIPWRNGSGEIIGIIGSNREITERKKAEEALLESEARYKAMFETAKEGILVADIETKHFRYANHAVCDMFGYTAEELRRMGVQDIHPKEALPSVFAEFEAQARGEKSLASDVPCLRKDGTVFYADINTTGVVIDQTPCNVGFFTDITHHKRAEEALRESEQRYRLLVEQLPAVTYTAALDEASTTLYVSPQVQEILGVSQADYKADPDLWRKLLYPDDRDRVMAEVAASHQMGKPFSSEYRMLAKDGRVVWIHDNARIIEDSEGRPIYLQGVMYDITEHKNADEMLRKARDELETRVRQRTTDLAQVVEELQKEIAEHKKAEDELHESKRFLNDIFDAIQDGISVLDKDLNIVKVNAWVEKMRSDAMPLVGKKCFEAYHNRRTPCLRCPSILALQTGRQHTNIVAVPSSDNPRWWFEITAFPLKDAEGKVVGIIEHVKDDTERKKAEESLRNAEERFRTIFENTVVGLYRTTPDGRILMANPAIIKMMGYKSFDELAQLNLEKEGFDPSAPRSVFKKRIEKEGKVQGLESVWIRRNGTKLFVRESASAVRDEAGNILYYEGTAEDITNRKKVEEKLMLYQQQLRSLASQLSLAEERLKRRIATNLHDNVSQNLAISKMKLDSLVESARPEQVKLLDEIAALIARTIEACRTLVFEMSPPVLYELGFEAAVGWLANQTRQRFGIETHFADDGKPKPLDTDVCVLLFQAVRELLTNVVKHANARKAKVVTRRVRNHIWITVEDDGVGFDVSSKTQPRSSKSGTMDYSRGGFGLFNILERLDLIGGSVKMRSKPGQGTKITLIAPLPKAQSKKPRRKFARKRERTNEH